MSITTDEEIAQRVKKGDSESFGILVTRYEQKITRYARKFLVNRQDIEDLVQQVFIKAYTNMQSFDTDKRFSPWIYRIAHNEFVNALQKKSRDLLSFFDFELDTLFPHAYASETADRSAGDRELKEILNSCLDKLDAKYREPLVLYFFEELGYQEIADILHIPSATAGIRLSRGKAKLRKIFSEAHPGYVK